MKGPPIVKPVAGGGGMSLIGLCEREVPAWTNYPAVPSDVSSGLDTDKLTGLGTPMMMVQ